MPISHSNAASCSPANRETLNPQIGQAVSAACARIAPSWPLDRFIAVNPFWKQVSWPMAQVSAELSALSGSRLLMPRAWFRDQFQRGEFDEGHLERALALKDASIPVSRLRERLNVVDAASPRRAQVVDVAERERDPERDMSLREFIVYSISQVCASFFDEGQAQLSPDRTGGLYACWRRQAARDEAPSLLLGFDAYPQLAEQLPQSGRKMIELALSELEVFPDDHEAYLFGLLLDVQGWASVCAYRHWTAAQRGDRDESIEDLLAIRIAWEWLLARAGGNERRALFRLEMARWPSIDRQAREAQQEDWYLQSALELPLQDKLARGLTQWQARVDAPVAAVQAVFCIDVRSEVLRRALEAEREDVQTLGFAGFFGLPIDYLPLGAAQARPQLPGLLAPRLRVTETGTPEGTSHKRKARLELARSGKEFRTGAVSSFSFVESLGLFSARNLWRETFGLNPPDAVDAVGLSEQERGKPRITSAVDGSELTLEARCSLAAGMLRAMSLSRDFARLVLLVGHGTEARNNPHAAGLECGACCGQSGEVNARAAAALLNEAQVRAGLRELGISIPDTTRFVAALHLTTTDVVKLLDLDEVPASHHAELAELNRSLQTACERARRERSERFGLSDASERSPLGSLTRRARDWAQVRPEWGLVDNAALIIARREHCRSLDLAGRAFLHDYRHEDDKSLGVLRLIMTAPMVVSHWINLQYYASTVDNLRYGSGNKVLHNVVGGHIGVFEGNGGDLRIGLPLQSLHDGSAFIHTPRRLSVFIEAPRDAIAKILDEEETVRSLVENDWLHLFQFDADAREVHAYRNGSWTRSQA